MFMKTLVVEPTDSKARLASTSGFAGRIPMAMGTREFELGAIIDAYNQVTEKLKNSR